MRRAVQLSDPRQLAFASLLMLQCLGCGGGAAQDTGEQRLRPVVVAPQPRGEQRQRQAPAIPLRNKRKAAAQPPSQEPLVASESDFDPSVDPRDLFSISQELPRFDVIGPSPEADPQDQFTAIIPPAGIDASSFSVVEHGVVEIEGSADPALQLPSGFVAVERSGYGSDGLPRRIRCLADGAIMALVPAGSFRQGRDGSEANIEPEFVHWLDPFYMDVTEVTLDRFQRFMDSRRQSKLRIPDEPQNANAPGDHPALGVSYNDARAYAAWAGKDLPTEAEWEKAARGPENSAHPWGNGRAILSRTRARDQIDAVGAFHADHSPYGIYDLAGNAREWCLDWYASDAYRQVTAQNSEPRNWQGPRAPSRQGLRSVRGNGPRWEVWHREGRDLRERHADVGFRCVLRAEIGYLKRLKLEAERAAGDRTGGK